MEQAPWHPKRLRIWRFHAPGTTGTFHVPGIDEEDAIQGFACIRNEIYRSDQTLFEGKGGWILENKLSGHRMVVTHGKPMRHPYQGH